MIERTNQAFHELDKKYYLQTFKRYPLALEKGTGALVFDVEGKAYIDALGGIAVTSVGHSHPRVVKAICDQAARLVHISNFYVSDACPKTYLAFWP